jgi:HEAT repeat protein
MPSIEEVRAALAPDELDYAAAARRLGPAALPHLREIARESDPMLASKAVHLAALVGGAESVEVVRDAGESTDPVLRVAAAGAARELGGQGRNEVLRRLLDDRDEGVRKVAVRSVGARPSAELRRKLQEIQERDPAPRVRELAGEVLRGGG